MCDSLPLPPEASPPPAPTGRHYVVNDDTPIRTPEASALLVNVPKVYHFPLPKIRKTGPRVVIYDKSAVVNWDYGSDAPAHGGGRKKGARITDMSAKVRREAVFRFLNAPCEWFALGTFTRRFQPTHPAQDWFNFLRRMKRRFDMQHCWGWIMEYQKRHVVHHHLFLSASWAAANGLMDSGRIREYRIGDKVRPVIRSPVSRWFDLKWIATVGDTAKDFLKVQNGGTLEAFRTPDAAARYIGKETEKSAQKQLPEGVEGGNRWWYASPECKAAPLGEAVLEKWPFDYLTNTVFDRHLLAPFLKEPLIYSESERERLVNVPKREH